MGFFSKRIDRQIESYQHELIETHYREVDNMYRQMRGWRHDYRNHIQTMKAYAASGDLDAIKNYLDLLDQDLTTVDTVIKTGNPMTDAILNSKISLARAKGIEVIADAHIPVKLRSSEIDLCCIIGNLFDNAIEASEKLPEDKRLIRVYMDMKNTQLYISFTNFTAGRKLKKEGGLFRSTKGEGHGFGLVRVDAIVERLEGYISRNSEDGAFTTEILLPQV
jgi:sensor histidine kinase regulating citrate/malate metabolism